MAARFRAFDWAATSAGPSDRWSDRLKAMVEIMLAAPQLATLAVGADRLFLYNDHAARHYGDRHPHVLGRPLADAFAHEFDKVAPFYDQVFGGESLHVPAQPLDPAETGTHEVFDAFLTPVRDIGGRVIAAYMTGAAIGERLRAEERLRVSETQKAALLKLSDALRTIGDPTEIRRVALKMLGEELGVSRAYYFTVERNGDGWVHVVELGYRRDPGQPEFAGRYPLRDFGGRVFEAFERGEVVAVSDVEALADLTDDERARYRAAGIAAFVKLPLLRDGEYAAGFGVHSGKPRVWSEAEIGFIRDIAARAWTGMERARAEAALRENEQRLKAIFDVLPVAVGVMDSDGRLTAMNPLMRRFVPNGVIPSLDDRSVMRWRAWAEDGSLIAPRDFPSASALRGESRAPLDMLFTDGNGDDIWTRVSTVPLTDGGGHVGGAVTIVTDTDDEKRAEHALRDSEKLRRISLEGGRMGAWRWDLRKRLIWGDPRFLALWGYPASDEPYPLALFVERMLPESAAEMWGIAIRAIETGEEFDGLLKIVSGPTAGLWIRWRGCADGDAPFMLYGVAFDVTTQRQAEERHSYLLKLSDTLRPLADPVAIQTEAMRVLGEHLSVTRAQFYKVDASGEYLDSIGGYTNGAPPVTERVRMDDFGLYMKEVFRAGRTLAVADVAVDPRVSPAELKFYDALGFRAFIGIPLVKDGRFVVSLGLHQSTARQWSENDLAIAEETADRTWAAVERARAEAALRESEERLRQFGDASQDVLWIRDAELLQWQYLTPAFETIYGLSRKEALTGNNYRSWLDLIVPEDREHAKASIAGVRAGAHVAFEFRIRRPVDGAIRWMRNTDFPITNEAGEVTLIGGIGSDITELREAELRLTALMEGIPQLVWRAVNGGHWTWASPQWTVFTGQAERDSHGFGWLDPVHPDDRDRVKAIWAGAVERQEFQADYRLLHAEEGQFRWFQTRATPVHDGDGHVIEWLGTSTDVDELRRLQDRQQVLVAELQHRVRNILAVVRSVFSRTIDAGGELDDIADHFTGRLDSLARMQVIVTQSASGLVDLENLIRDELLSVGAGDGPMLTISGPPVALPAKAAESIGLAIHELTTNALKYGALRVPDASLDIRWTANVDYGGARRLHLTWTEQGVPAIPVQPVRQGFGSELITQALPYRLGAETNLQFRGGGVRCSISVSLPDEGASAGQAWKESRP